MNGLALAMVLVAAIVHAGWNLAAKRVSGGARFVFLYYTVSAVACTPVAIVFLFVESERPQWSWLLAAVVTAVCHIAYGVVLQRGYAVGDLSVVYPLARGTGPLLSVFAAVVFLGERPGVVGIVGAVLVIFGVLVIATGKSGAPEVHSGRSVKARRIGVGYGLLTGVTIAAYTLWDAHSVTTLAVPPVVYFSAGAVLQSVLFTPYVLRDRSRLRSLWREHWKETLLVGILSPVAYLLVLFAMRMAPVSLVAPAREVSIVLGGLTAWRMFGEPNPVRRFAGSVVVLGGIAAIAVG